MRKKCTGIALKENLSSTILISHSQGESKTDLVLITDDHVNTKNGVVYLPSDLSRHSQ